MSSMSAAASGSSTTSPPFVSVCFSSPRSTLRTRLTVSMPRIVSLYVSIGAPDQLFYQCGIHAPMSGVLTIIAPAIPPTVKIVFVDVANFITLKSTGTNGNGWNVIPEFNCGLSSTNWSVINPFTNSFNSGTNTTTFPRLEAVCGSTNILIRVLNQSN